MMLIGGAIYYSIAYWNAKLLRHRQRGQPSPAKASQSRIAQCTCTFHFPSPLPMQLAWNFAQADLRLTNRGITDGPEFAGDHGSVLAMCEAIGNRGAAARCRFFETRVYLLRGKSIPLIPPFRVFVTTTVNRHLPDYYLLLFFFLWILFCIKP